jgi:BirA family transcriptional regulator, biotin operon repressor / biotin---[acetyl-CoA-carboxylase] ligase
MREVTDDSPIEDPPGSDDSPARWEGRSAEELRRGWNLPRVLLRRQVGSTNDLARSLAIAGAPVGTLVLAEEQVSGRGRAGRGWHSPPGAGLWCSFVAAPSPPEAVGRLPLLVGLRIADALDGWATVRIKWPNDLVVEGRKLGGILCEAAWRAGAVERLVIGIGLNLLQREEDFPVEIRGTASSLRLVGRREVDRYTVASAIFEHLRPMLFGPDGVTLDPREFAIRDALRGVPVQVRDPATGRTIGRGRAGGIDSHGALRLEGSEGTVLVRSGTVVVEGETR